MTGPPAFHRSPGRDTAALPPTDDGMDRATLLAEMQAVVDAHGPWHSHNVALPFGVFTMGPEPRGDNYRTVKFVRLVADLLRRPLHGLRVLDLACAEGLYALEFARHGAEVVGVEGRWAVLAKAEFARRALALDTVRFEQGDVREVTVDTHGRFDVVLCSGILYHLDQPAAFDFLRNIRAMTTGVCLIDTRIALTSEAEARYGGRSYRGSTYREHAPGTSAEDKAKDLGASLDNDESFWFTRHDLANLLADLGFTSVLECLTPVPWNLREDRVTLAAMAGGAIRVHNEVGRDLEARRWPPNWAAPAAAPGPSDGST